MYKYKNIDIVGPESVAYAHKGFANNVLYSVMERAYVVVQNHVVQI